MAKIGLSLASVVFIVSFISTAQAGFEWKGPLSPPVKAAPAGPAAEGAQEMSGLEPVIMWDGSAVPALEWNKEISMPAEKVEVVEEIAIETEKEGAARSEAAKSAGASLPAEEMAALPPAEKGEEISGFGSDLPLVIALQQVVPPGYQFSFASGVKPGSAVSWEGGRSWRKVLADMLSAQGLGYKVQNNVVVIGHFPSMPSEAMPKVPAVATPSSNKAEQIPDDMIIQNRDSSENISSSEPVVIRRQKPSSLLKKQAAGEAANVIPAAEGESFHAAASGDVSASAGRPLRIIDMPESKPQDPPPAWSGAKGQTLRDVLKNWSDVAGVELYWSIDYDYRLQDDVGYPGTYDEAVGRLLDRFATVRPQPYGQLHQSGDSPRVLVVKSYDLTL